MHTDYVRVVNTFQSHDLALDRLALHTVVKFCFLVNFDSVLFHGSFMVADVDDGVGALTYWLANLIVIEMSVT